MKKCLLLLIVSFLFVTCQLSNDYEEDIEQRIEITISGKIATSHTSQVSAIKKVSGKDTNPNNFTEGVITLTWDKGDEIMVTTEDELAVFCLKEGEGTKYALFKGDILPNTESYSVVYPAGYTDDVLYKQTYVPNGFGKDLMKLSTREDGTVNDGFCLVADNALLGLQIKGKDKINKIVLTRLGTKQIYTLICPTVQLTSDQSTLFYIVVPAGKWEQGFSVDIYNHNNILIEKFIKRNTAEFIAGKAMMMPVSEVTYEYVDLGLSVKWATCNVGAVTPEGLGEYFAFGEIVPQTNRQYLWKSYAHCKGSSNTLTKYNTNSSYGYNGFVDNLTTLLPEDDAATVNWNSEWRIPTWNELLELKNNCTWVETIQNGVKGHKVTSKIDGYTDKFIFLPYSGIGTNNCLSQIGAEGDYACSEIRNNNSPYYTKIIHIKGGIVEWAYGRERGISIRPVRP
jgi:hypothetical protein